MPCAERSLKNKQHVSIISKDLQKGRSILQCSERNRYIYDPLSGQAGTAYKYVLSLIFGLSAGHSTLRRWRICMYEGKLSTWR